MQQKRSKSTKNTTAGDFDKAWAAFAAKRKIEEQPAGSYTVSQYAARFNVEISAAQRALDSAVKLKQAVVEARRLKVGTRVVATRCYKLV